MLHSAPSSQSSAPWSSLPQKLPCRCLSQSPWQLPSAVSAATLGAASKFSLNGVRNHVQSNCGQNDVQCFCLVPNGIALQPLLCNVHFFRYGWIGLWDGLSTHLLDIATASEVLDFILVSARHLSNNLSKPILL